MVTGPIVAQCAHDQMPVGCWPSRLSGKSLRGKIRAGPAAGFLQISCYYKLAPGFAQQLLDPGTCVVIQEPLQHFSITIDLHPDNVGAWRDRDSSHEGTEAEATGAPEAGASTQSVAPSSCGTADYSSVTRGRWHGKVVCRIPDVH
jgi:hypothetical protein